MAWCDTGHTPHIGPLDARVLAPIGLCMVHISLVTLEIAGVGVLFFWLLETRGLTPPVAWRVFRSWAAGKVRWVERPGAARRRVTMSQTPYLYDP